MTTDVRFNTYRSRSHNCGRIYALMISAFSYNPALDTESRTYRITKVTERGSILAPAKSRRTWWELTIDLDDYREPALVTHGSLAACYRTAREMIGKASLIINCDREPAYDPDFLTA
jgi:hypothetical protein